MQCNLVELYDLATGHHICQPYVQCNHHLKKYRHFDRVHKQLQLSKLAKSIHCKIAKYQYQVHIKLRPKPIKSLNFKLIPIPELLKAQKYMHADILSTENVLKSTQFFDRNTGLKTLKERNNLHRY